MKGTKLIAISLLVSIVLSLAFTQSVSAPTKPSIRCVPIYYTGKAGFYIYVAFYMFDAGQPYVDNTDVFAWQIQIVWDNTLLEATPSDIIAGTFLDSPRVGPWGVLTDDADAGTNIVWVSDGSKYGTPGAWGGKIVIQDDYHSEIATVSAQNGNQLTLSANLVNSYTMAAHGGAYPWPTLTPSAVQTASNRLLFGRTTNGVVPGKSGNGLLATVRFRIKASGTCIIDMDQLTLGQYTFIRTSQGTILGDAPSIGDNGDPGYWQSELLKQSGQLMPPWQEDLNADGDVGVFDLASVGLKWGAGPGYSGPEDINKDGYVNIADLSAVSIKYETYANTQSG
jgi:hypothetical protein